jgi:Ribosomal protein L17
MADYWLDEKQLIHKLFKVLVPRYKDYNSSYTKLILGPKTYPGYYAGTAILELKGMGCVCKTKYGICLLNNTFLQEILSPHCNQQLKIIIIGCIMSYLMKPRENSELLKQNKMPIYQSLLQLKIRLHHLHINIVVF